MVIYMLAQLIYMKRKILLSYLQTYIRKIHEDQYPRVSPKEPLKGEGP